MVNTIKHFLSILGVLMCSYLLAQNSADSTSYLFKQINDTTKLRIYVYNPPHHKVSDSRSAIIFYFGGGWSIGNIKQFIPQAKHFASRGMVAVLAEYRVAKIHGVAPVECVKDANASIRYLREHALELGIDPARIVASGGSAGGHLAAATALCDGFDHQDDNLNIDHRPNALVLYNPVIDNSETGFGYQRIKEYFPAISPLHNIKRGAPPTLFMLGTEDHLVPVLVAEEYKRRMHEVGARCDVKLYEGQKHSFFNFKESVSNPMYDATLKDADNFLVSLGYIK